METVITSQYLRVKIHPLLCLWLRNYTNHNRAKSSTCMNNGKDSNLESLFSKTETNLYAKND